MAHVAQARLPKQSDAPTTDPTDTHMPDTWRRLLVGSIRRVRTRLLPVIRRTRRLAVRAGDSIMRLIDGETAPVPRVTSATSDRLSSLPVLPSGRDAGRARVRMGGARDAPATCRAPRGNVAGTTPRGHVAGTTPHGHVAGTTPRGHVAGTTPHGHVAGTTPRGHVAGTTPPQTSIGAMRLGWRELLAESTLVAPTFSHVVLVFRHADCAGATPACHVSSACDCHVSSACDCHVSSACDCHVSSACDCHVSSACDCHVSSAVDCHVSSARDCYAITV